MQFSKKGIARGRVGHSIFQARSSVEFNAQSLASSIGAVEIRLRPVVILADELDFVVAGFGDLGKTLFEG